MADMVSVREVAGSWSYTVIPDGDLVGTYGWADSEAEAWQRVAALRGEDRGMAESVSMAWDSTHGEEVMRGEWKACAVCGYPANLGPICRDLRCEVEYYEREGEGDD